MWKKGPLIRLEASKSSIKELFNDLLDEIKGFKYQITIKVELKNTTTMKLNFLLFISIQQPKQWQIINSVLISLFKKFGTELKTGVMKDLVGLLN